MNKLATIVPVFGIGDLTWGLILIDDKESFPIASCLSKRILSLPIHGNMDLEEADYVVKNLKACFN